MVELPFKHGIVSRKYRLMKGNGCFIITPHGMEYEHKRNNVIVSASVEDASFTNRIGVVLYLPINYKGNIKQGDLVIVGHNIFRTYYDMQGKKRKSSAHFKEQLYIIPENEVYLYKNINDVEWLSESDFCAVKPINNDSRWSNEKYKDVTGIIKALNKDLINQNVKLNDTVVFKSGSEYEFYIEEEKYFIMRSSNIFIIE